MATLRSVRHVDARFIEHRYLHALQAPIETRGSLRFDPPSHLEKTSDPAPDGSAERLVIDGDRVTIDRGVRTSPIVLSLRDQPEIGPLVDGIRATLSGDTEALLRAFDVTPSGSIAEWQLVLRPRASNGMLRWMRVSGYRERITAIDTEDNEGDRSEMSIVEQTH